MKTAFVFVAVILIYGMILIYVWKRTYKNTSDKISANLTIVGINIIALIFIKALILILGR